MRPTLLEIPGGAEMILGFITSVGVPLALLYILSKVVQGFKEWQKARKNAK